MAAVAGLGEEGLAASPVGYREVRGVPFSSEQWAERFEDGVGLEEMDNRGSYRSGMVIMKRQVLRESKDERVFAG